jgi:acetyl esterase/lipase
MALAFDPQAADAFAVLAAALTGPANPPVGDVAARRAKWEKLIGYGDAALPESSNISVTDYKATAQDGYQVPVRWYAPTASAPEESGPAALYLHSGGMILGRMDLFDRSLSRYVALSGVPILSVEYRLAPENPHPVPVEDAYGALLWLHENASMLGVDRTRIAVFGESAGGGLAAATALLSRERGGPAIAKQILIMPMLDDRTLESNPQLAPFALWTADDNRTGWQALLGPTAGGPDTSPFASAARAADLTALPSAYIEVGELDLFCAEDLAYAGRLHEAGVGVEFHLRPGVPHGFDLIAPAADVSRRAIPDRVRALRSI